MNANKVLYGVAVAVLILVVGLTAFAFAWPTIRRTRRPEKDPRGDVVQSLPYDGQAYLTTHNSFSNYSDDYFYAQQSMSMTDQLNIGARGLMLDTHWCPHGGTEKVVLAHGGCRMDMGLRFPRSIFAGGRTFAEGMAEIAAWMRRFPREVVTIFLEDYVVGALAPFKVPEEYRDGKRVKDLALSPGIGELDAVLAEYADMIYAPPDKKGPWPLVSRMADSGKRLVVFNDTIETQYAFNTWSHVNENQFSTVTFPELCRERGQSAKYTGARALSLANIFPELPVGKPATPRQFFRVFSQRRAKNSNSAENISRLIDCTADRLRAGANADPVVNFIALDFAEKGSAEKVLQRKNRRLYDLARAQA